MLEDESESNFLLSDLSWAFNLQNEREMGKSNIIIGGCMKCLPETKIEQGKTVTEK